MSKLKIPLCAFVFFVIVSCQQKESSSNEIEVKQSLENSEKEEDEEQLQFDGFEEAITSKVNGLKVVQNKSGELDSISNGARRLSYRVEKSQSRAYVYDVLVFEQNSSGQTVHFRFQVDSLTGEILNPDGK